MGVLAVMCAIICANLRELSEDIERAEPIVLPLLQIRFQRIVSSLGDDGGIPQHFLEAAWGDGRS